MTTISLPPLVLIGPSGAGKSTIAEHLIRLPRMKVVPTLTTRPIRPGEGTLTHTFVTKQTFNAMRKKGDFIGTTHVFGNDYGLPKLPATNDQLVILLRAPFVKQFQESYPDSVIVQLEAPLSILHRRLISRGDQDRFDETVLEKEIALGQSIADIIISTDQPVDDCVDAIVTRLSLG